MADDRLILRPRDACKLLGLSRTTIWRMTRDGSFPRPIKLGLNAVGWRVADVQEWVKTRPAA